MLYLQQTFYSLLFINHSQKIVKILFHYWGYIYVVLFSKKVNGESDIRSYNDILQKIISQMARK